MVLFVSAAANANNDLVDEKETVRGVVEDSMSSFSSCSALILAPLANLSMILNSNALRAGWEDRESDSAPLNQSTNVVSTPFCLGKHGIRKKNIKDIL